MTIMKFFKLNQKYMWQFELDSEGELLDQDNSLRNIKKSIKFPSFMKNFHIGFSMKKKEKMNHHQKNIFFRL